MNNDYYDIISRINEAPQWWDEAAVPRYCEFAPAKTANIYADEAVLLLVKCQACGREFRVCLSRCALASARGAEDLAVLIMGNEIEYGDPPNVDCCPAGPTMNSIPLRVLQYWKRGDLDWARDACLEKEIECEWASDDVDALG